MLIASPRRQQRCASLRQKIGLTNIHLRVNYLKWRLYPGSKKVLRNNILFCISFLQLSISAAILKQLISLFLKHCMLSLLDSSHLLLENGASKDCPNRERQVEPHPRTDVALTTTIYNDKGGTIHGFISFLRNEGIQTIPQFIINELHRKNDGFS